MAKVIINGAQFRPFTMDELLKPLALATEEHHRIQDKYDSMIEDANKWNYLLPQDQNSRARQVYDEYVSNMWNQVNQLNTNGLNPQIHRELSKIKRDNPIQAFEIAQQDLSKWQQFIDQNPNMRFQNANPTIDDFLWGNTPNKKYADLNKLTQDASLIAQAEAKSLIGSPTFSKAIGSGGQYFQIAQTQGIPAAVIAAAFDPNFDDSELKDNEKQSLKRLREQVGELYNSVGYSTVGQDGSVSYNYDLQSQADITRAIRAGLSTGIETTAYSLQQNRGYMNQGELTRNAIARFPYTWDGNKITGFNEEAEIAQARQQGFIPEYDDKGQIKRDDQKHIIYKKASSSNQTNSPSNSLRSSSGNNYNLAVKYGGVDYNGNTVGGIYNDETYASKLAGTHSITFNELSYKEKRLFLKEAFNLSETELNGIVKDNGTKEGEVTDAGLGSMISSHYQIRIDNDAYKNSNNNIYFKYLDKVDDYPTLMNESVPKLPQNPSGGSQRTGSTEASSANIPG